MSIIGPIAFAAALAWTWHYACTRQATNGSITAIAMIVIWATSMIVLHTSNGLPIESYVLLALAGATFTWLQAVERWQLVVSGLYVVHGMTTVAYALTAPPSPVAYVWLITFIGYAQMGATLIGSRPHEVGQGGILDYMRGIARAPLALHSEKVERTK